MLRSVPATAYAEFKSVGYRLSIYRAEPVASIADLVQLAYLDVNRTLRGIDAQQSLCFKSSAAAFICDLIERPPRNQPEFDIRHKTCCEACLTCPGSTVIHYGQAQKLLNMSLKYLYNESVHYSGKMNAFRYPDAPIEEFFHLPIDNQLLAFLVDRCGFRAPRIPWSKWTYGQYMEFQRALRSRLRPGYVSLTIDYLIWNKQDAAVHDALAAPDSRPE